MGAKAAAGSATGNVGSHPAQADLSGGIDRCDITVVHPRTVAAVQESLIAYTEAQRVADVFKVLGDPSRCRLVYALLAAGEICVCDLASALGMSESNVSHHLRVLRAHGLVRPRRQGKMVYYAPDDEHISLLLDLTREHVTHAVGYGDGRGPATLVGRRSPSREAGQ